MTGTTFHCWDSLNQEESDAKTLTANDGEHAAQVFAELAFREEPFETCEIAVFNPTTKARRVVHVHAEPDVRFVVRSVR